MRTAYLFLALLLWQPLSLADGPFNTQVNITETSGEYAEKASVEVAGSRVVVFMTNPEGVRHKGLQLAIQSDARAMIVEARLVAGRSVPVYKRASGEYYFFGQPGEYEIGIYQFAVDMADKTTIVDVWIGPKPDTKPPPDIPPPSNPGSFDNLKTIVAKHLQGLNDPITAKALGLGYLAVIEASSGKTRDAIVGELRSARIEAFRGRFKLSKGLDWSLFLEACDAELKIVAPTADGFRDGIKVICSLLTE